MARYDPFHYSLDCETAQVRELPVLVFIDCLIVKIRNSNGLELCPTEQLLELQRLLQLEIDNEKDN